MKSRFLGLAFGLFLLSHWSAWVCTVYADELPYALIQSIDGGGKIKVENAGFNRELGLGDEMNLGDSFSTGADQVVTLTLSNRFVLVVDKNSTLEFGKTSSVGHALRLDLGRVRGIGKKLESMGTQLKMVIKTKSATLGVRGTDFIVSASSNGTTEISVVEGKVEVAKTEAAIASAQGIPVGAGQKMSATSAGLTDPVSADASGAQIEPKGVDVESFTSGQVDGTEEREPPMDSSKGYLGKNNEGASHGSPPANNDEFLGTTNTRMFEIYYQNIQYRQLVPTGVFNGAGLSWNPTIPSNMHSLFLRGGIGFFYANDPVDVITIYGLDFKFLVGLDLPWKFFAEFGPTLQFWSGNGVQGGLSMVAGIKLDKPLAGFLERIFVGGDLLLAAVKASVTNKSDSFAIRAGLGVSF